MTATAPQERQHWLVRSTSRVAATGLVIVWGLAACSAGAEVPGSGAASMASSAPSGASGSSATSDPGSSAGAAPSATSAGRSSPSATASAGHRSFSLVATGDVLLHPPLWDQARRDAGTPGVMNFAPQLAGVRPLVSAADLAVCHLETPLAAAGGPFRGYPQFAGPPQVVDALKRTGYDACTTASNHSFDGGAAGVDRTLAALDRAGIAHAGTARSRAESDTVTLVKVTTSGGPVRVALLSYAYGFNGIGAPGGDAWRGNLISEAAIRRQAAAARRQGADVVVVSMHWGTEYNQRPNAQQLAMAPRLIASPDIDLLLGHHAHVVQPLERIRGEWVVYGLGNLLAAHGTAGEPLREGLLVRFGFTERAGGHFAVTSAAYAPLLMTSTSPRRVLDVAAARGTDSTANATARRLDTAWTRTSKVVNSRGAKAAGLSPISSP